MNLIQLQEYLHDTGRYNAKIDGLWGPVTENSIIKLFVDGPDTALSEQDFVASAARLGCGVAHIKAVTIVEAAGAGFFKGKPLILPEPHRFSKNTSHRFDQTDPDLSYPKWGTRPYARNQSDRYEVLLGMIRLDVDAGFMSASYGKFQIMGENYKLCGFDSPVLFAEAQSRDEPTQLKAFEAFIRNTNLLKPLRECNWDRFASGYNGTAYKKNNYHLKLAAAYKAAGGR